MVGSRRVKGAGSALTEGARRATGVTADGAAVGSGALAPGQRWSASRKRDVVLRLLRGESLDAVSREVGLEVLSPGGVEGPRAGAKDGPRQPVSVGPLPQPSSATGASTPASASSKSRKPTGSSSAGIARSRSKPSTAGSFEISPMCARPSPSSSNATTSAGASRSWRIARRSKRARNTSYAMPRSANVCPRNRVRYREPCPGLSRRGCFRGGEIAVSDPGENRFEERATGGMRR